MGPKRRARTPPRTLTPDEQHCLEELGDWAAHIQALRNVVGAPTVVARNTDEAMRADGVTAALATMQRELRVEAQGLARRPLTPAEAAYYIEPMAQATAAIGIVSPSADGEAWHHALGEAHAAITLAIRRIKDRH